MNTFLEQSQRRVLTVSAFTLLVKEELETRFSTLSLRGEVSNLKAQSSGHIYFTLKDADAQVSCVLFRLDARSLLSPLKEGDEIILDGELTLYPPRGVYQIVVRKITPVGVGALLLKYQNLKKELEEKGWFQKERKKELPKFPKRIGVITSPTGAVIRDILHVLTRRVGNFHLILYPVKVQGEGAKEEIANAIKHFNQYKLADVLIVGRGGGSFEDLFPFNELIVADAILQSEIPIISAVGHETDFTIADFVADLRAPTPSAAAEIVFQEKALLLAELEKAKKFLDRTIFQIVEYRGEKLDRIAQNLKGLDPRQQLKVKREKISNLSDLLDARFQKIFKRSEERFLRVRELIEAVNPMRLLSQGYAILFTEDGRNVIRNLSDLAKQQTLIAKLKGGEAKLSLLETYERN